MLRRIYAMFTAVLFLSLIFSVPQVMAWPFGGKKETTSKTSASKAPASQPAAKSNLVVSSSSSDEEEIPEEPGEEAPLVPQLPQIPKIPTVKPITGIPSVSGVADVQTPDTLGQDPEIVKIKSQIQDIIKINEGLKSNYSEQAAEIQKISEQARIHQRILKDLETAKAQQKAARAGSESYLNEEKIKLIQKETEKNQKFLDNLQSQDVSKNVKPIPMQEQEARKS